jgi:hypothetical protein
MKTDLSNLSAILLLVLGIILLLALPSRAGLLP